MCMCWYLYKGQMIALGNWLSLSIMWFPGIKFRLSGQVAEPSDWPMGTFLNE